MSILYTIGIIFLVILFFNFMIFVHELGHFLAGKWRGAHIDRFQIWFGRPIWRKKIWGVQFGLGWIPAGGFVSLPQLESMEGIEGKADVPRKLPPLKPLDKVIIAAAGPLFSLLLAYAFALVVWGVGKPVDEMQGTTVGYVLPDSPAAQAGVLPGDKILSIDGTPVTKWMGKMEGVQELIALSEHETIELTVARPNVAEPCTIRTGYTLPEKKWWQRKGLRRVGMMPAAPTVVGHVLPGSPAEQAGIQPGQRVLAVNNVPVYTPLVVQEAAAAGAPLELQVAGAAGEPAKVVQVVPQVPANWQGKPGATPIIGLAWENAYGAIRLEHPSPQEQVNSSLKWMGSTLDKLLSRGSSVGMEHLSGPVGIGSVIYKMMDAGHGMGWRLVLWFAVVLNVNLAVLNILPLPVVDGGHVVFGFIEMLRGKPVSGRLVDWVMSAFVVLIFGLFLFLTFKDVGDLVGSPADPATKLPPPEFAASTPQS